MDEWVHESLVFILSKATTKFFYTITLTASVQASFSTRLVWFIHDGSSFLWKQESCLLLTLAAEEPDLSLLSPMVSVVSTYPQLCTRKECEEVPKVEWITKKRETQTTG